MSAPGAKPEAYTGHPAMSENKSAQLGRVIAAFAVGALVGVGIVLRYAPRSGKETRELVADKGREFKGKATDAIEDARDFIGGTKAESAIVVEGGKEARREARANI